MRQDHLRMQVVLGDGERFNNATDNDYLAVTAEQVKQVIMSLRLPEARADRHGSVFMQTVQNSREELTDSKTSFLIT